MKKITSWIVRYLPSEIVGTLTAIITGVLIYTFTKNELLTAFAGTWGENLGFYGVMITRDVVSSIHLHRSNKLHYGTVSILKDLRNILLEFGPAEILDSFVIRPFTMYIFQLSTNNLAYGIILGKLAADFIFYIPTIIAYEMRKKYLK